MTNLLDDITPDDIGQSEAIQTLAEIVGLEALKEILSTFSGDTLYIPMVEAVTRRRRDKMIYDAFDGRNYSELAAKWRISARQIRNIVQQQRKETNGTAPKQQEMF